MNGLTNGRGGAEGASPKSRRGRGVPEGAIVKSRGKSCMQERGKGSLPPGLEGAA